MRWAGRQAPEPAARLPASSEKAVQPARKNLNVRLGAAEPGEGLMIFFSTADRRRKLYSKPVAGDEPKLQKSEGLSEEKGSYRGRK